MLSPGARLQEGRGQRLQGAAALWAGDIPQALSPSQKHQGSEGSSVPHWVASLQRTLVPVGWKPDPLYFHPL